MKIELIMTGDELLDGRVINTNASELGEILNEQGLKITRVTTVGDHPEELEQAFQRAAKEMDITIVTGGLGPTDDDRTSEILAKVARVPFVQDESSWKRLQDFFRQKGRPMASSNEKQSFFPKGARIIPNRLGTADGFSLQIGHSHFYVMPGVPREMRAMFKEDVLPAILKLLGPQHRLPQRQTFKLFGQGESHIADLLADLYPLPEGIEIGYRAIYPEVHLSLIARTEIDNSLFQKLEKEIQTRLSDYIYTSDQRDFIDVFADSIKQVGATLALAESCTGGLLASLLTEKAGASDYFLSSAVAYSNEAKTQLLDVPKELIEKNGAVSAPVAQAMVEGALKRSGASHAIAITGIAGPSGGTPEKPVGTVYIAVSSQQKLSVHLFRFPSPRKRIQIYTAYTALNILKRHFFEEKHPLPKMRFEIEQMLKSKQN